MALHRAGSAAIWGAIVVLAIAHILPSVCAFGVASPRPHVYQVDFKSSSCGTTTTPVQLMRGPTALSMEAGFSDTDLLPTPGQSKVVQTYVKCGKCNACFPLSEQELSFNRKVQCSVCEHTWFQTTERLINLNKNFVFRDWTEEQKQVAKERAETRPYNNIKKGEVNIFVGNLPFVVGEKDLTAIFSNFGRVASVQIIKDDDEQSRGYGFVNMVSRADGQKAIQALHNIAIQGRVITVREGQNSGGHRPLNEGGRVPRIGGGRGGGGRGGGGEGYGNGGGRGGSYNGGGRVGNGYRQN